MYNQIPYMMSSPLTASSLGATKAGTSLLGKISWSSLLTNAQKTLNVVNQAIPLYYQVKPVFKNIKTLGKIGREFTKQSNNTNNSTAGETVTNNQNVSDDLEEKSISQEVPNPTFFL